MKNDTSQFSIDILDSIWNFIDQRMQIVYNTHNAFNLQSE